jgi:phage-related tail protein
VADDADMWPVGVKRGQEMKMKRATLAVLVLALCGPIHRLHADEPKKEEVSKEEAAKPAVAARDDVKKKFAELKEAYEKAKAAVAKIKEEMKTAPSEERINLGLQFKAAWKKYAQSELTLFDFLDERNKADIARFQEAIERYQKEIERVKQAIEETKKAVEQRKARREYLEKTLKEE